MKKIKYLLGMFFLLFVACSTGNKETINLVKNATPIGYLSIEHEVTYGKAIDSFLGNSKWSSGVTSEGEEFVNVKGSMYYQEKKVNALLQFTISKDREYFEVNALEINELPQSRLMIGVLLEKIFEEYSDSL